MCWHKWIYDDINYRGVHFYFRYCLKCEKVQIWKTYSHKYETWKGFS